MLLPAVPPVFNEPPTPPGLTVRLALFVFSNAFVCTCGAGFCGSCTGSGAGNGLGGSGARLGCGNGGAGFGGGGADGAPPIHIINSPFFDVTTQPLNVVLLDT